MQTPFPVDSVLTAISLAYRNPAMIADSVLPRLMAMGKQSYEYYQWAQEQAYNIPDTQVGRKGRVKEVEFTAERLTRTTRDDALDDGIPIDDINNAAGSVDPVGNASMTLTDLVLLARERRVAGLVFAAGTYPAGHKVQLAGNQQWSDPSSTPIADINAGLDVPLIRPNTMTIGQVAWTALRSHPDIMKSVNRTAGDRGNARVQDVAELFELENLYVGRAFYGAAAKGQAFSKARVWGPHAALHYTDPLVTEPLSNRVTFGWTAQYLDRLAGQEEDSKIGMRGGIRVRVGESVDEVITAADLGYYIEDAA